MSNSHRARSQRCWFCNLPMPPERKEVPVLAQDQSTLAIVIVCAIHPDEAYDASDAYQDPNPE